MRVAGQVVRYGRRESGSERERSKYSNTVASEEHGRRSPRNASIVDERLSHSLDIIGAPIRPKDLGVSEIFPYSQGYVDYCGREECNHPRCWSFQLCSDGVGPIGNCICCGIQGPDQTKGDLKDKSSGMLEGSKCMGAEAADNGLIERGFLDEGPGRLLVLKVEIKAV